MLKKIIVLVLVAVACHAETPASSQGVVCGKIPGNIFPCSQMPSLFPADVVTKCKSDVGPCVKLSCLFTAAGIMKAGKLDKPKAKQFFDAYAAKNPSFTAAVNHAKAACVGDKDLPAQGTFLNCPAFDVLHCTLISFIKNVPASNWLKSADCELTRQFAQFCPICPSECFADQVPNDSCHACLALPRSA